MYSIETVGVEREWDGTKFGDTPRRLSDETKPRHPLFKTESGDSQKHNIEP